MERIENLRLRRLTMDDADHALLLSAEANWNQTRLDWEFMIRAGSVRGLVAGGEHLVATAGTLLFERTFAWISMILVTERWRGRGLATRLMGDCLEQLRGEGIVPMLDATEEGREVYRRLGFSEIYALQRVEAVSENVSVPVTREIDGEAIQALTPKELANIAVWDRERFGACRSQVLGGLRQLQARIGVRDAGARLPGWRAVGGAGVAGAAHRRAGGRAAPADAIGRDRVQKTSRRERPT